MQGYWKPTPVEWIIKNLPTYLCQPNPNGALAPVSAYVGAAEQSIAYSWQNETDQE